MRLSRFSVVLAVVVAFLLALAPTRPAQAQSMTLNPITGTVGTVVTVSGFGFLASTTVYIFFGGGTTPVASVLSSAGGGFITQFSVPTTATPGVTFAFASYSPVPGGPILAQSAFTVTQAQVALSPVSGDVGDQVQVSGFSFGANRNVSILFDGVQVGTAQTDSLGNFSNAAFTVPESAAGSHTVLAQDTGGSSSTATFTTGQSTTAQLTTGAVGDQVTLTGKGFAANAVVTISFSGTAATTNPASVTTSGTGSFSASFTVPSKAAGVHQIIVSDGTNSDALNFTVTPSAALGDTAGSVGAQVTVSGTGFAANSSVVVVFSNTPVANVTADANGSFQASFVVPAGGSGPHTVRASDGTNVVEMSFSIGSHLRLSAAAGYAGSEVTVTGAGFKAGQPVTVSFGNEPVATGTVDAKGDFEVPFTVPPRGKGVYEVKVTDGTNTMAAIFEIQTSVAIEPVTSADSPGHVGDQVAMSGIGYAAGEMVTVTYDGAQIATATVLQDGTYSVTFEVPPSAGGEHIVIAGVGGTTSQFTFVMESDPPLPVRPLKPEMGIKASAEAYFDWQDVTDPSGVTYELEVATSQDFAESSIVLRKTGITRSEYTIPLEEKLASVDQETPYYWHVRAVDGASNEGPWSGAGRFHVGFSFSLSQPLIYGLIGGGAALIFGIAGFFLGRRSAY